MEKIPCIKCNSQLWEYIKPYLEKWSYEIYHIDSWNTNPILVLNYVGSNNRVMVTNLFLDAIDRGNRELITNVEEFLEKAAGLKGFIYKRKDMKKEFTKSDLKPGMIVKYRKGDTRLVLTTDKGELFLAGINPGDRLNIEATHQSNLKHEDLSEFDIIEVYQPTSYHDLSSLLKLSDVKCIWKDQEILEVTLEEVAAKFGVPEIKIKQ